MVWHSLVELTCRRNSIHCALRYASNSLAKTCRSEIFLQWWIIYMVQNVLEEYIVT